MKKHSPNFHTNLEEADNAKNNRATTFFWTVVFLATLMLGFSMTSCTKEVSKPQVNLRAPIGRTQNVVDITFTGKPRPNASSPTGYSWTIDVILSRPTTTPLQVVFSWDDSNGQKGLTLSTPISAGTIGTSDQRNYDASSASAKAVNFKLLRVDGDSGIVYRLKQVL